MSIPSWAGAVQAALPNYIKKICDETMRKRVLYAKVQAEGNIITGEGGSHLEWFVKNRRHKPQIFEDMASLSAQRKNRGQRGKLPWRGYRMSEALSKADEKMLQNDQTRLADLWNDKTSDMVADFTEALAEYIYSDENAGGWNGLETMFGTSGASAGNRIATPSDTYAEINTGLGFYGGTWTGTWPNGYGDSLYDFWSPLLVDATNTGWAATTKTWENTALECIEFATTASVKNGPIMGRLDLGLLPADRYRTLLALVRTKERIVIQQSAGVKNSVTSLGYGDTFYYEGVEFTPEFGMPSSTICYMLNAKNVEIHSLNPNIIEIDPPFWEPSNLSWRWDAYTLSQLKFESPKHFVKIANYT